MELSILVARILAVTYIAAGIAAVRGKISFAKLVEDFERSPALTFVSGFLTLVIGMLLVHYHNRWEYDWTVLVTVIGWMSLFKGVMLIVFPQAMASFKGLYKNTRIWGVFMIVFGVFFGYLGFAI